METIIKIEPYPNTPYPESAYSFRIIVNGIWIDTVYSMPAAQRYKQRLEARDPKLLERLKKTGGMNLKELGL